MSWDSAKRSSASRGILRLPSSLRARLLCLTLLAVVPPLALTLHLALDQRRLADVHARSEALRLAHLAARDEAEIVRDAQLLLTTLAQLPQIGGQPEAECRTLLARLLAQHTHYLNLGVADSLGNVTSSAIPLREPVNEADRDWFQQSRRTLKPAWGTFQIGRITGREAVYVSAPRLSQDGRFQGVVFAAVGLRSFGELAEQSMTSPGAVLLVLDAGGRVLTQHPEAASRVGTTADRDPLLRTVLDLRAGTFEAVGADGIRRLYACSPLMGGPRPAGFVVVGIAAEAAFAAARRALTYAILWVVIVAVLALVATWIGAHALIIRPARGLLRATGRLSAGDLAARADVGRSGGELGQLARAFDRMAEALQARQVEMARAREELRQSEERFRLFMDHSPTVAFIKDAEGRYVYVNATYERTFQVRRDELQGKTDRHLFPDEVVAKLRENDVSVLFSGQPFETMETVPTPDGKPHTWFVLKFPISQPKGPDLLGGVAIDMTARQRLEDQLRQAQKMEAVGRLAGGVAHDFNNLLTAIMGYTQLLSRRLPPDDPLHRDTDEILKAADHAATLTRQLLSFSRRDAVLARKIDLNAVVADMGKMLRRLLDVDIELVVTTGPAVRTILADPGQVEQVLMNLVVNARDALPDGGRITIETGNVELSDSMAGEHLDLRPGPYVLLAVTDTGTGMDAETKARIFEPFFTTKTPDKGTGLGLSTVYGIIRQCGGSIQVHSEPGMGSIFKIYFPVAEGDADGHDETAEPRGLQRGTETVLVVEDQEAVASVIRGTLEMHGYALLEARNGAEALDLLERHGGSIHLLVTDVVLPGMKGPELARIVRERRPGTRVLCISGYGEASSTGCCAPAPGRGFLQKPFTPSALARKVRELLDSEPAVAAA